MAEYDSSGVHSHEMKTQNTIQPFLYPTHTKKKSEKGEKGWGGGGG